MAKPAGTFIKEALLRGETLTADEAMAKYGGNRSALSNAVLALKAKGHKFTTQKVDGLKLSYTLTPRPNHRPEAAAIQAASEQSSISPEMLPKLGQSVMICALAIDPKGVVGMTLRSGKNSWRVTVTDIVAP